VQNYLHVSDALLEMVSGDGTTGGLKSPCLKVDHVGVEKVVCLQAKLSVVEVYDRAMEIVWMTEASLSKDGGLDALSLFSRCLCMFVPAENWREAVCFGVVEDDQVRESDAGTISSRDRQVKVFFGEVWKERRWAEAGSVARVRLDALVSYRDIWVEVTLTATTGEGMAGQRLSATSRLCVSVVETCLGSCCACALRGDWKDGPQVTDCEFCAACVTERSRVDGGLSKGSAACGEV